MEQDMLGHKNKLIHLLMSLLIIMFVFNACMVHLPREYSIVDISGKRLTAIQQNIDSFNELLNKGFISYIEFSRVSGDKYHQISIVLYTTKKYNTFRIHSFEFEFEDKKEIVRINKTIKLNQEERLFSVEDTNELNVITYFEYIPYEHSKNKVKLYMQNIFNKNDEDIGKEITFTLKANYSFDNSDIVTQENKYRVSILEGMPEAPKWIYRFFPEM